MKKQLLLLSYFFLVAISQSFSQVTASIIASTNVSCFGLCNGAASATAVGGTAPYTYSWNTNPVQTSATAVGLCAGAYTVTVTDATAGTSSVNVTITQPSALNATYNVTNVTCNGGNNGSASATGSGGVPPYTYSWSPGTQTTATATNLIAGTYTVNITDASGCTTSANAAVSQANPISVSISGTSAICVGNNTSLTAFAAGGTTPYSYSWSPPSGLSSTTASNVVASPTSTVTYTLNVTDVNGCTSFTNKTITVDAIPIANAGPDQTACDANFAFTDLSTGAPVSWYWDFGGGNTAPNQNPTMTYGAPGNYIVTLYVTSAAGCVSATDTALVTSYPYLSVYAGSDVNICSGNSFSISPSVTGGTSPFVYSWTPVIGLSSANSLTTIASPTANTTYSISVTDNNGCVANSSINLFVNPLPSANAGPDQTLCENNFVFLNGSGGNSYVWSGPNSFTSNLANPNFIGSLSTSGNYYLTVTDTNNCSNSDFVAVNIMPATLFNGHVNFLGTPVATGNVNVYKLNAGLSTLAATANINSGMFSMYLASGDYIFSAELDTSIYHGAITTYDTSSVTWNAAMPYTLNCGDTVNGFVNVIQTTPMTGNGIITGQIFGGNGPLKTWQQGDPIPGVDVSLEQNPGSVMLAQTQTDAAGAYSFVNVPVGNYSIYVDVPGLGMSATYDVNITAGNNTFNDAMFYVDSTGTIDTVRAIVLGKKAVSMHSNNVSVYPNPYNTFTNINYELSEKASVNIEVYNVLGEKVATVVNTTKESGKYNERFSAKNFGASAGVYFVRININNKVQTVRLVETN